MLSTGEAPRVPTSTPKTQRACDQCRKRKIRCDNVDYSDDECTSCLQNKMRCTYHGTAAPRSAPKWYITGLEERVERFEALLDRLHPGVYFPELGDKIEIGCWTRSDRPFNVKPSVPGSAPPPPATVRAVPKIEEAETTDDEQPAMGDYLSPNHDSSHPYRIVHTALQNQFRDSARDPQVLFQRLFHSRRPYFWSSPAWERLPEPLRSATFTFPPPKVIPCLIDLYFDLSNIFFPLFHRPTFLARYNARHHETDPEFGALLLLVCAVGSRWSDDPIVMKKKNPHSSGWVYFEQVTSRFPVFAQRYTVQSLQAYALSAIYLVGSSSQHVPWLISGFALRIAHEMGLHSRNTLHFSDNRSEAESRKRLFWVLVAIDRCLSAALGRPCAVWDEDIDLDFPIEVDDEYWIQDGREVFQQPPTIPSKIASFNAMLRLMSIRMRAFRKMNVDKYEGMLEDTRQMIIQETERIIEEWHEQLPRHLVWTSQQQSTTFFRQSSLLFTLYCLALIGGHRPTFHIPSSLACAVRAAKNCVEVLHETSRRDINVGAPWTILSLFGSGFVIQMGAWDASDLGRRQELFDVVGKCIHVLSGLEGRWLKAGRHADLLRCLISVEVPRPVKHEHNPIPAPSRLVPSHHVYDGPPPPLTNAELHHRDLDYTQAYHIPEMQQYGQPMTVMEMEHQYSIEQAPPGPNYPYGHDPFMMTGLGQIPQQHEYNHWTLPTTEEEIRAWQRYLDRAIS